MTKFWAVVTVIVAAGFGLLLVRASNPVHFTDLETECQYERGTVSNMDVRHNKFYFSGHFPVQNPDTDLSYSYSQSDDEVTLNIQKSDDSPISDFYNTCNAVAVYDGFTNERLEPGLYTVTVKHAGEETDKRKIRID
ncbi:MAG: hypothetical protein BRC29_04850 [Nanohaloarchaea archaeon SW_7_43_1]|nr:MAG: hypothetical protein BRC29_04850 [Nanohaloarchaea archaeon SW_7_43_1]